MKGRKRKKRNMLDCDSCINSNLFQCSSKIWFHVFQRYSFSTSACNTYLVFSHPWSVSAVICCIVFSFFMPLLFLQTETKCKKIVWVSPCIIVVFKTKLNYLTKFYIQVSWINHSYQLPSNFSLIPTTESGRESEW